MARQSSTARRYAEAAFEIALRDDTLAAWRRELDAAAEMSADPQLERLLDNPAIPLQARIQLLGKTIGSSVSRPVLNLLTLLVQRGRIEQLPRVAAEFRRLDDRRNGITNAMATSASALEPDEIKALTDRLVEMTGGRVNLDVQVDPGLLGGVVVRVGDRLIDGSVRGRLERLRSQLVSGAF